MDNNQNNNKNKKNANGLLILVIWAVGLTVLFNYFSAASRQANTAASTHEILYTELLDMVDAGQVEKVLLVDGRLEITPVKGYVYTDADGNTYDENYTLFTMPISGAIGDLIQRLDEKGGEFGYPYVPEMSPILEFMIAYIPPMVLLIGAFMLFMNLMAKRGGGIGPPTPASIPPSARNCPRARCWWARRAPARPCWPRPWPARRGCPSSPSPAPDLWKCSWA